MGIDELCALPVADLAARDSALFLWATFPQLPEALRLIKAWGFQYKSVAFVWLKKNKRRTVGFTGWAFGRGETPRSACWPQGAIQNGRRQISISLSFPPLRPTAKSRMRPGKRLWPLWATCPGWSSLPDSPRPAGMCGEMKWQARSRTLGQSVPKIPGPERRSSSALCKCPQRFIQNQNQNGL